jgi:hypothetical protein
MWMRAQLRLGPVAGIPVGANLSVVVIFGLLAYLFATSVLPATVDASRRVYWAVGIIVVLLFFAALLAHELAHALVARDYGVQVRRITLWIGRGDRVQRGAGDSPPATRPIRCWSTDEPPVWWPAQSPTSRVWWARRVCSPPGCCGLPRRMRCWACSIFCLVPAGGRPGAAGVLVDPFE